MPYRRKNCSNWQEAIAAAKDRRCDMFPMAMRTPERSAYLDFTSPYLEVPNVVIGRIEAPFIQRLNELEGGRVGIVEGYAFAELLRKRNPSLQLVTVESEQEGLRKLQNRELIGYVTTLATASYYRSRTPKGVKKGAPACYSRRPKPATDQNWYFKPTRPVSKSGPLLVIWPLKSSSSISTL